MQDHTATWGSHLHSQEIDVAVWWHQDAWTARQHAAPREYRFHCLGHTTSQSGIWQLELAQANKRDPGLHYTQGGSQALVNSFCAALQDALSQALGKPVGKITTHLILWNPHDAPEDQPCPYRHAVEGGYWPVQRKLFHLPADVA